MSNSWIRFDSEFSADSCVGLTTETILDNLQFNVDLDQIWEQKFRQIPGLDWQQFRFPTLNSTTKTILDNSNVDLDQIWQQNFGRFLGWIDNKFVFKTPNEYLLHTFSKCQTEKDFEFGYDLEKYKNVCLFWFWDVTSRASQLQLS